jgi:glycosyltransferase involved in cell wall biosynthesis
MINKLAIVIPAYKSTFFDTALSSIASQTNKNFTLYIGDDNSPDDLLEVVNKYKSNLSIVYKRFEENLGSTSIVSHWNRCVSMTDTEDWIWLFSDDDIMGEDCVDSFYTVVEQTNTKYDLYRFNCSVINEGGSTVSPKSQYPKLQTSYEFLHSRLTYRYHSYIVNCIFSKRVYFKHNGFVNFPGAWASDDATWVLFGQEKQIFTVERGEIQWRHSSVNISGNTNNLLYRRKKYDGTEQFIKWIYNWAKQNKIGLDDNLVIRWFFTMLKLLGFKNINWVYLKSKTFRTFFWKKSYRQQLKLIRSNLYRNVW